LPQARQPPARSNKLPINRDELVRRLAEVCHLTYVRQKNRDQGVPLNELTLDVTDHDRERAEDIVAELERLGVLQESAVPGEPEHHEPPEASAQAPPESKRQPLTDIWGYPIAGRRSRSK
jgi:hypothetical protein